MCAVYPCRIMKKMFKKALAAILVLTMILSFAPMCFAAEESEVMTECGGECEYAPSIVIPGLFQSDNRMYDENGNEMLDANGIGKLDFRNVFVLQMKYSVISGDSKGRLDFDNISSGKGYYITNGRMQEITWKWTSASSRMRFYAADGTELSVNAGKSMIHFVSSLSNVKAQ